MKDYVEMILGGDGCYSNIWYKYDGVWGGDMGLGGEKRARESNDRLYKMGI